MTSAARLLLLGSIIFAGCGTTKRVAVSTFRVLDAPHRYVRERIDPEETTTVTTTTVTQSSDVVTPGRPVEPVNQRRVPPPTAGARSTSRPRAGTGATPSRPPSGARSAPTQPRGFPTAKPVPGKPGYVYSVDPKGGIIDVTGYKSGDKAKDPYTQQIFVVP